MRLFLTSAGFLNKQVADLFLKDLDKTPDKAEIFMVADAQTQEEKYYIEESKKELVKMGIKNISIFNLDKKIIMDEVSNFDAIYVCGGNTYSIMKKFRETGLDKIVKRLVNSGKIYIGVSAGSIIAGPDIEIAGWGMDGDLNEVGLQDLTGLNLVKFAIFPHFEIKHEQEVVEFKQKVSYPVIELSDQQAVYVEKGSYKIIS